MSNLLRLVTLDRINRKKDRSVSYTFITTTEQSTDEFAEADRLLDHFGQLFFKSESNISKKELYELDKFSFEFDGKTKSQRLRNAIYVLWKKRNDGSSKEEFYSNMMEKFIKHIIDQIPNEE